MLKRTISILIIGILAFSLAACGNGAKKESKQASEITVETAAETVAETEEQTTESETEAMEGMANPFLEFETLSAAERAAGVTLELPEGPEGYPVTCYRAAKNLGLLEIIYLSGSANSDDSKEAYRIRKAQGDEDISGDYNEYAEVSEQEAGGKTVTLKGNGGMVYCAIWTEDGCSYAIDIDMEGAGMTAEEVLALAAAIK